MNAVDGETQRFSWALLTGEYPPQPGGVADYTYALAGALAAAGDSVHVFAPPCAERDVTVGGISIHRLPDVYGSRARATLLATLAALPRPRAAVLQYVPQSFGMRGCNIAFARWLRRLRHYPLFVMFHEVAVSSVANTPLKYRVQAMLTRAMAADAIAAADAIFISTPSWKPLLEKLGPPSVTIDWTPVPTTIAAANDRARTAAIRAQYRSHDGGLLLGHFGTYRESYSRELLAQLIPLVMTGDRSMLFLGRGSRRFVQSLVAAFPELATRLHGAGGLGRDALADHLAACDIMLQPFEDGVTTRRTSVTASLALGVPVVTTEGSLTEPLWRTEGAVGLVPVKEPRTFVAIVDRLAREPERRAEMASRARDLYERRFAVEHTVSMLRQRGHGLEAARLLIAKS